MANWALEYDGTDDYVTVPHTASLSQDIVTVEAWVYISQLDIGTQGTIIEKSDGSKHNYKLTYEGRSGDPNYRKFLFLIYDGSVVPVIWSTTLASAGNWYYLVGIRDTATDKLYLYVDSVLENETEDTTTAGITSTGNLKFGANNANAWEFLGIIDEIRISNVKRSQAEIDAIYNSGNGVQFSVDGDTVALWHKNEGTSSTIEDETANNNDGTITGASWVAGYDFLIAAQAVGSGAIAIAGTLEWKFKQSVGAGSIAIAGVLGRLIKIGVGAGSIAISGALSIIKTVFQAVGAGSIAISGALTSVLKFLQNVGAGSIAISGTLSTIRKIFQSVGGGSIAIAGVVSYTVKRLRILVNFTGREMVGYKPDVGYPYTYPFYYDTEVKIRDFSDPEVLRNGK